MTSWLHQRVEFVKDEPGTLLILLVLFSYLLFFPGGACSFEITEANTAHLIDHHDGDHGEPHADTHEGDDHPEGH